MYIALTFRVQPVAFVFRSYRYHCGIQAVLVMPFRQQLMIHTLKPQGLYNDLPFLYPLIGLYSYRTTDASPRTRLTSRPFYVRMSPVAAVLWSLEWDRLWLAPDLVLLPASASQ